MFEQDLQVIADGKSYGGWTTVAVKRSLEEAASTFNIALTDRWLKDAQPVPLEEGMPVRITIDKATVLSGYIDDADGFADATQHDLAIVGRSAACDLVDCSAVFKTGRWRKRTILQIAKDLVSPFGRTVSANVNVGDPLNFALEQGETVFSALDRACRLRGVLVTSDAAGNVVLTRAGQSRTSTVLEYGTKPVLSTRKRGSWRERFSQYILKGQSQGTDSWDGVAAAHIQAKASDPAVLRYRPLLVTLPEQGTVGLQAHVKWEVNVRAGRSRRYTYAVTGWYCAEGLWQPNTMVHVTDTRWGLDEDLLIISTEFSRNMETGTTTLLEVGPRESFDLIAFPKRKQKRKAKRNEASTGRSARG